MNLPLVKPFLFLSFCLLSFNFCYADVSASFNIDSVLMCSNILKSSKSPALTRRNYEIDFRGSFSIEILNRIDFLYVNYFKGTYVDISRESTLVSIPQSEWDELFYSRWSDFPMGFNTVIEELRKVAVSRVDVYDDKTTTNGVETGLLISSFISRDIESGEVYYNLELDPRLGQLLKRQLSELISVSQALKSGFYGLK